MPDSVLWNAASLVALVVLLPVVGGPILVFCTMRFNTGARLQAHYPDDPNLPNHVRWLFYETWTQFKPLGFKPTVYISIQNLIPNSISYLAIFDHPVNGDGAAAMVVAATAAGGQQFSGFVAEYCTVSPDGVEVCTNNNSDTEGLYRIDSKHVRKFPRMRDLRQLYEAHKLHMSEVGLVRKRRAIPPEQRANELMVSMRVEFDKLVSVNCLRRCDDGNTYRIRGPASVIMTWKQLPGISHIGRILLRRRGRKWLADHGFSADYEEIDYKQLSGSQLVPSGLLPVPDWYAPIAAPIPESGFRCEGCGQELVSNNQVGSLIQCPICQHTMQVPTRDAPANAWIPKP